MRLRCFVLLLSLPLATSAFAQDHSGHSGTSHEGSASPASSAYMRAMEAMQSRMDDMKMTGKAGVDFAEMMIPHHQSAIDMAKAYLSSAENDPTITKIANDVVSSQQREIDQLKAWLAANRPK